MKTEQTAQRLKTIEEVIDERYVNDPEFKFFIRECYHADRKKRRFLIKQQKPKLQKILKDEMVLLRKFEDAINKINEEAD